MSTLPNKIIPIPNPDKNHHEKWYSNKEGKLRNPLNIPSPTRIILAGGVNSGKTTIMKNIIVRAKPIYETIIIIHCSPEATHEYDDLINFKILSSIPTVNEFNALLGDKKGLVILEDLEYKGMKKDELKNLDRLMGYVSTHLGGGHGISVFITCQDWFSLPTIIKRMANFYILWKTKDLDSLAMIARKSGLEPDQFKSLMKGLEGRDSLWLDFTKDTPYPVRLNGFEMIQIQK